MLGLYCIRDAAGRFATSSSNHYSHRARTVTDPAGAVVAERASLPGMLTQRQDKHRHQSDGL